VRAELKHLDLEPDPATLPAEPEAFSFIARMLIGPRGSPGEESFDVVVCSPEWLAAKCLEVGLYDARHHLVVNVEQFDKRLLRTWLESRVNSVHAQTWAQIGERIGRLGYWEFEDYQPE
jgi:immunity protein 8 of polymorphic toxin system